MKCEGGCGRSTSGFELFDYCAGCSKNLCPKCMQKGCCGHIPAESGMRADEKAEAEMERKKKR